MNEYLRGTLTALVTPMNRDGTLDAGALDVLVDLQLSAGINGVVPCGTTGESATLTTAERDTVLSRVVKRVAGRVPVVAGTGSNNTASTLDNQRRAKDLGATHGLVVTPYYNRPSPEGLFRHYTAIAEGVDLPIIAYNVPSRTGGDLKPDILTRIARIPGVQGIKEASGDVTRVSAMRAATEPNFTLLSGDDVTTCPFILLGGDGVISVASNLVPREMCELVNAALAGQVADARRRHNAMRELFAALFIESNPIPVKAAMAMQGRLQEAYRLPLCELRPAHREQLQTVLRHGGWL